AFRTLTLAIQSAFASLGALGGATGALAVRRLTDWLRSLDMQIIWGAIDMLPWLFVQDEWCQRLLQGDCQFTSGSVRPDGVERLLRSYDVFLRQLRRNAEVLEFAYDWRLSNDVSALALESAVQNRWWPTASPEELANIPAADKVTIVAHSM